jgi:membrane associated rhomboid family serine protease
MNGVYRLNPHRKKSFLKNLSVNTWIILINVILFFVFLFLINLKVLTLNDVAIKPSNILQGKYLWTFLTSMFMHGGFFHLFVKLALVS